MSAFHENFQPDPLDEERLVWRTSKLLFREAVVAFAPPYPEYPKLKVSKSRGPSGDPSCPSARDIGHEIEVVPYSDEQTVGDLQERAWVFIINNAPAIEASLRHKLFQQHLKCQKEHLGRDLSKKDQKYWAEVESRVNLNDPSAVDQLFKLVGVGLADSGLDECGFSSFEFQSGWDRDHGIGILMHKDRVLAAGGMGEMIYGTDLIAGARSVQSYDLDDGDLKLTED